jgi:hypothetical protein
MDDLPSDIMGFDNDKTWISPNDWYNYLEKYYFPQVTKYIKNCMKKDDYLQNIHSLSKKLVFVNPLMIELGQVSWKSSGIREIHLAISCLFRQYSNSNLPDKEQRNFENALSLHFIKDKKKGGTHVM